MEKDVIQDIYKGQLISCWKDNEMLHIVFPFSVVSVPLQEADTVIDELSKIKTAANRCKKRKQKKQDIQSGQLWEREITDIVNKTLLADVMTQEKAELLFKYLDKENESILPPIPIQEFFNIQWSGMMMNIPVFWIVVSAFKTGMIYQEHRKEFEGAGD